MTYQNKCIVLFVIISMCFLPHVRAGEPPPDDVFTLGEVVVKGERGDSDSATTVTEVSAEDIKAKGARTIAEALEFLPGVSIRSAGKGEAHVSLRGFEQRQVKVLIDGVPARENWFGTVDLSMLPADAISKLVITKGASSVLYGSNTMGGVINIITKKGGVTPKTSFSASFGDYGTQHYFLSHGGSRGRINYWLSGGYQTSDGFRLSNDFDENDPEMGIGSPYNENGGKRDLSDYVKKSLDMKLGYDPGGDSRMYLSLDYVDNERGIPTFYNRYWEYHEWRQWQVNLTGEHKFTNILNMKTRLFYVKHEDGISDVSWDDAHTTSGKKWFDESYYHDYSAGGEIQAIMDFFKWNSLRLGLNYMKDNHKEGNYLSEDCWNVLQGWDTVGWQPEGEYTAQTYTIAVEDEIAPSDRFSVLLGLSYDTFEPTKTYDQPEPEKMDALNPQIGIVYNMTDTANLYASVGRKIRFPSLKELYSTLAGGNPDLDPERTIAWEVGASTVFFKNITGEVALFYYDIEDLIDTIKVDGENVYININEAVIYGGEATIGMSFAEAADISFSYTYMTTEDKSNDDRELEGRPRHRVNFMLSYIFPFGLTVSTQASYTREQYWEDSNYEWAELPDYFQINVRLSQKLKKVMGVDSELFFQGMNILDEDYYETSGPEPGFNFLAGISMQL